MIAIVHALAAHLGAARTDFHLDNKAAHGVHTSPYSAAALANAGVKNGAKARVITSFTAAAMLAAMPAAVHAQPLGPPVSEAPVSPTDAPLSRFGGRVTPIASGAWTGPRHADGQPDIAGHWSNTVANQNNFQDPQAGPPGEPSALSKLPRDQRAPSRVTDPADGKIPYLPEALAIQQDFEANFAEPTKQRYIEPLVRCAPGGVPKSFYWHGFEIKQFAGFVVILFNSSTRIIPLTDKPALAEHVKLWNGDSRGYWDGNTLVVRVSNINGKALFGRAGHFISENGSIEERYVFNADRTAFNYIATFTDPTIYARPWTATIPVRRYTEKDQIDGWHYEVAVANRADGGPVLHEHLGRSCVENNGSFGGGAVGVPLTGPIIRR